MLDTIMHISLFDFTLPDACIALRPIKPRSSAKLLVWHPNIAVQHDYFYHVAHHLRAGDALVLNNVSVLPARLFGQCLPANRLHEVLPANLQPVGYNTYDCFIKHSAKLSLNTQINFYQDSTIATVISKNSDGTVRLQFSDNLIALLKRQGRTPLPPYILKHRDDDIHDISDYQTELAQIPKAVAASTAGFHFDNRVWQSLQERGVSIHTITLAVGAGTFRPVTAQNIHAHVMHHEHATLNADVANQLNNIKKQGGRIIAVGTTALRTLESAANKYGMLHAIDKPTDLFITPGYQFKVIDGLITNFHPPRSTPLMLTAALIGRENLLQCYTDALAQQYRWCSYGDACLFWK